MVFCLTIRVNDFHKFCFCTIFYRVKNQNLKTKNLIREGTLDSFRLFLTLVCVRSPRTTDYDFPPPFLRLITIIVIFIFFFLFRIRFLYFVLIYEGEKKNKFLNARTRSGRGLPEDIFDFLQAIFVSGSFF